MDDVAVEEPTPDGATIVCIRAGVGIEDVVTDVLSVVESDTEHQLLIGVHVDVVDELVVGVLVEEHTVLVENLDGELIEIGVGLPDVEIDRRQFHAELRGYVIEKGHKPGWAAHKFKERFGAFPPWDWNDEPALEPTLLTRRWIKSRNIAWAKARGRRDQA